MKINATSSIYSVERAYRKQATRPVAGVQGTPQSDKVDLSTQAVSFTDAFTAVKASIEVKLSQRPDSVDTIKAQIAAGTYTVDAEDLASSILLFT